MEGFETKTVVEMTPDMAKKILASLDRLAKLEEEKIKLLSERCLDIEEAARHCGIKSKSTMYKLTSDGEIAYYKVGKANVYKIVDLDKFLRTRRIASRYEIENAAALATI